MTRKFITVAQVKRAWFDLDVTIKDHAKALGVTPKHLESLARKMGYPLRSHLRGVEIPKKTKSAEPKPKSQDVPSRVRKHERFSAEMDAALIRAPRSYRAWNELADKWGLPPRLVQVRWIELDRAM